MLSQVLQNLRISGYQEVSATKSPTGKEYSVRGGVTYDDESVRHENTTALMLGNGTGNQDLYAVFYFSTDGVLVGHKLLEWPSFFTPLLP